MMWTQEAHDAVMDAKDHLVTAAREIEARIEEAGPPERESKALLESLRPIRDAAKHVRFAEDHRNSNTTWTNRGKDVPTLLAFKNGESQVKAWCPFCVGWHHHGAASVPGLIGSHCLNPDSPFQMTDYYLKAVRTSDFPFERPKKAADAI